jgi:hypothetical protein
MYSAAYEQTERERARAHASRERAGSAKPLVWQPYPDPPDRIHPQRLALESLADVVGYGGAAGGGKSDLLLGLAGTQHHRAIIFRREFTRLSALIERSREIYNASGDAHSRDSYNENLHRWRLRDGRLIEFAAMKDEKDKFNYQGRPYDLYSFDEVTEFTESQFRFVIGWNRTTRPGQRCRVLVTFNPPMDESGDWVTRFFLPWLAYLAPRTYQHPNPAKPGELRWYTTIDGKDVECDGPEPFEHQGELLEPKSRTFIPASLKDNPVLEAQGYAATVNAMPEPYRSLLKGQWGAGTVANPWQLIPTSWVRAAEARHRGRPTPIAPLNSVGGDIARGGKDRMSIAKLYGNWLAPLECYPGREITDGPKGATLLLPYVLKGIPVGVDIISIGSSVYDSLIASADRKAELVRGINFGAGAEGRTSRNGKLHFKNIRAAAYWMVREALDPENGDDMALPDDPELREELCAPRFMVTAAGIQIEPKEKIIERLGRSPDKADALALAFYNLTIKKAPIVAPAGTTRPSPWK